MKASGNDTPRSTSPRTPKRPKHDHPKGKGKGKGKQQGKSKNPGGKGKQPSPATQTERFAPPPEPPWKTQPGSDSSAAPTVPAAPSADPKIQALLGMMQKQSGSLSTELQTMLQEVTTQTSQQATKELHLQVTRLGQAKKQMQIALHARSNLYLSWQKYVADAIKRWEQNVLDYQEEESRIEGEMQKAREGLLQAKESLEEAKQAAVKFNLQVSTEEEGDDDEAMLQSSLTGKRIHQNMTNLVNTLQELHHSAVEDEQSLEPVAKHPRTAKETVPADPDKLPAGPSAAASGMPGSSPALQAFGVPPK